MKLVIGLGNPESRFDNTRHNIGFSMLDTFALMHDLKFKEQSRFKAFVAEYHTTEKVLIVKPLTYYNDSGLAVQALADFYKVNSEDILIVHDDLALPLGSVRTRIGGSSAGNNGVKSITASVGEDTARLRVGIWSERRNRIGDVEFVLGKFSSEESEILKDLTPRVHSLIESFITGNFELTTHKN